MVFSAFHIDGLKVFTGTLSRAERAHVSNDIHARRFIHNYNVTQVHLVTSLPTGDGVQFLPQVLAVLLPDRGVLASVAQAVNCLRPRNPNGEPQAIGSTLVWCVHLL